MGTEIHPVRTTATGVERKLAAILSADVAGYSRLMGEDEVGTLRTLQAYREVTDALISQYHGRVVNTAGDSVLAEFASAVDAVQCAVEIQQALTARNADLPSNRKMEFRIGINVGDVVVEGERLYGDGVNVAARLQGLADASGIFISGTVYDQVENKLALDYEYLGEQAVKNIARPVRVWRIIMEPEATASFVEAKSLKSQVQGPKSKAEDQKSRRVGTAHRNWVVVAVAGLVLLGGGILTVRYLSSPIRNPQSAFRNQEAPALPLPDKPSIAVLPFKNMSGDPEQEYFGDGMMDDLITDLSKLSGLFVIAHHSAFLYKGKVVKVQEVSKELGVRYVLEGSVRAVGNRLLITAQLVDGTTGGHVWADRYDRPLQDLYAVQEEVRRKILVHIGLKLTPEEYARLERVYTPKLEAHTAYTRAVESLLRFTPVDTAQARQWSQQAIVLDSTYATAYALLGMTYYIEWLNQWSHDPQALERAFELAQQALALDDSLPLAHELLGAVYCWRDRQHEPAIAELKQALAHSPNWFSAHIILGLILNLAGRPEETIANAEQALRLSPLSSWYLPVLGNAYRLTRRYEEAITTFQKILAVMPQHGGAHAGLAAVYSEVGWEEEARAEAAEVLRINPRFSLETLQQRSLLYKDPAELERHLAALRKAGLK